MSHTEEATETHKVKCAVRGEWGGAAPACFAPSLHSLSCLGHLLSWHLPCEYNLLFMPGKLGEHPLWAGPVSGARVSPMQSVPRPLSQPSHFARQPRPPFLWTLHPSQSAFLHLSLPVRKIQSTSRLGVRAASTSHQEALSVEATPGLSRQSLGFPREGSLAHPKRMRKLRADEASEQLASIPVMEQCCAQSS